MGSSFGAVIDYFVAGLPDLVHAVEPRAEVADCWTTTQTTTYVVVGRSDPESSESAAGALAYGTLGHQRLEESYSVPICVEAVRDGPAHKPARDAAIALLDVIVKFVHDDPTLGGLIISGRYAQIGAVELHQTVVRDGGGRTASRRSTVLIQVVIRNTTIP